MKLSVVIPAHNEDESIAETVLGIHDEMSRTGIEHEILVINDSSTDSTEEVIRKLTATVPALRYINNNPPTGFGRAVQCGLNNFSGDCVAIMMADGSDSPEDLVRFYEMMKEGGYDAVFGSRFDVGGSTFNYPKFKLVINRISNLFIRILFGLRYNDVTNAFKLYRRETIFGLRPFLAPHFNLTVELPLKVIVRGYSYTWLPNRWNNRKSGTSKLRLKEMGSRYLFIILYCFIEKYFSLGDYRK